MRRFIAVPIFVCFLLLVHSLPAADPQRPPNILFIIGDDHAPYVFGAYGNAKARTPHLDQFASTALRFDRAYCNSPVCTASRQSFLTGRLPHSIGVTLLKTPLGEDPVTLAELLKPLGYATAACGKMHFNSEKRHGFEVIYDRSEPRAKLPAVREDFPFKVQPPWKPFRDPADVWLNSACLPQGTHIEDMPGTMIAERAVDFMREHKDGPFLLFASFHEPHSPFYFPVEYRGMFKPEDFIPPEIGPEDADQIPAIFRGLTPEQKRGIIAAYYTSAAFLDYCVGKVLEGLEETGLAENTIVIYLGDHGYNLGHHGRFEKHSFYEPAVHSPLVVRWPGHTTPGTSTSALTEFIDLYPTVAEICGAAAPKEVEGRSLVGLLEGKTGAHREFVFGEYLENEEVMIRDGRYKLVYSTGNRERADGYATGRPPIRHDTRLFDLANDPDEFHNLASKEDMAESVLSMKRQMMARLDPGRTSFPPKMDEAWFDSEFDRLLPPPEERGKRN